jgi:hypothetical protein
VSYIPAPAWPLWTTVIEDEQPGSDFRIWRAVTSGVFGAFELSGLALAIARDPIPSLALIYLGFGAFVMARSIVPPLSFAKSRSEDERAVADAALGVLWIPERWVWGNTLRFALHGSRSRFVRSFPKLGAEGSGIQVAVWGWLALAWVILCLLWGVGLATRASWPLPVFTSIGGLFVLIAMARLYAAVRVRDRMKRVSRPSS